jgi:hypothetical protein
MNKKTKKRNNTAKFSYLFLLDLNMAFFGKIPFFSWNMETKKRGRNWKKNLIINERIKKIFWKR